MMEEVKITELTTKERAELIQQLEYDFTEDFLGRKIKHDYPMRLIDKQEALREFAFGTAPSSFKDFLSLDDVHDYQLNPEKDKPDDFPYTCLSRKK